MSRDFCIAIQSGRIVDVLPWSSASCKYRPTVTVHLPRHALIPGLVNAHTHAAMVLMRGLADDLPLMEWLQHHIWPAEARWVSRELVRDGTELAIAEMLRAGTTCFNDMYFFADETARVAAACGMRACVGLIVLDFPTVWAADADEYLARGLEIHERHRNDSLIRTAFAPHAPYTVSDAPLERIRVLAEELDLPVHMHVHETPDEVRQGLERQGERPLQRLQRLGLVTPSLVAVHMTQLEESEVEDFASAAAHVVHCPESNLKLVSGRCPVQRLANAGVNVALGTDGAASNNDLDLFGEMRTAALLGKMVADDAGALTAEQVLQMATLNGARALGWEEEIGSLVPGKAADLVAVDLGDVETQPVYDPLSQLIYAAGRDKVTDVWVAGRHLLKDRVLTTLDAGAAVRRAADWGERIAATDTHRT